MVERLVSFWMACWQVLTVSFREGYIFQELPGQKGYQRRGSVLACKLGFYLFANVLFGLPKTNGFHAP